MQPTTPTRRADALANHERIVSAAQALFVERGLDVEISEIAERAGVGIGTLYRHYANRDDLLRGIVYKTCDEAFSLLQTALTLEDPVESLRALPRVAVTIHRQLGSVFGVMHDARVIKLFKESEQLAEQMPAQVLAMLADLYDRGVSAGVFRAGLDREIVALTLMGSIGPAIKFQLNTRPLDDFASALADFYVAILTKNQA
jgi:AcrR family transcriptional regulator